MINTDNDLLIYGKQYRVWRDGEYLGIATWVDDPNIGEAFTEEVEVGGEIEVHVIIADQWQFA